jgi:hypothetical protein
MLVFVVIGGLMLWCAILIAWVLGVALSADVKAPGHHLLGK